MSFLRSWFVCLNQVITPWHASWYVDKLLCPEAAVHTDKQAERINIFSVRWEPQGEWGICYCCTQDCCFYCICGVLNRCHTECGLNSKFQSWNVETLWYTQSSSQPSADHDGHSSACVCYCWRCKAYWFKKEAAFLKCTLSLTQMGLVSLCRGSGLLKHITVLAISPRTYFGCQHIVQET